MSKAAELANLIGNINAGGGGVNRNVIINGAMNVAQRGTSATNPGGGYATLDRFRMSQNSSGLGNFVMSQDASAPTGSGFSKSLKLVKDGATTMGSGNSAYIHYNAEGLDVQHLCYGTSDAKPVTISFWVKSSIAGTYGLSLGDGAANRGNVQTYAISATNTWEYKSVTFVGDTGAVIPNDNTAGFSIHWVLGAGTNYHETSLNAWTATHKLSTSSQTQWPQTDDAEFYLTGCQAEVGQNPTEFEHEPFGRTYEKCERYFQKSHIHSEVPGSAQNGGSGTYLGAVVTMSNYNTQYGQLMYHYEQFRTKMRAAPTAVAYNLYSGTAARIGHYNSGDDHTVSYAHQSENGFRAYATSVNAYGNNNGGDHYQFHYTADAEL